ncbi:GIY-YIG nuclease family protein [Pollutibacter soli]|uniref:GIY-YIG nuclease family protein n=1 Tax=Pollutibacter soli TaxID=3034157 RepID=UPI003AF8BC2B
MNWQVYILYSPKLDRYYTGCTSDLDLRIEKHRNHFFGNTVFTTKAEDWEIFLTMICNGEKQAKSVELHIKKMKSKKYIENLKAFPEMVEKLLTRYVI